jgi:enoyl-CoA hydratase/carnithine racemase
MQPPFVDAEVEFTNLWSSLDDDRNVRTAVLSISSDYTDGLPSDFLSCWPASPLSTAKPVIAAIVGPCFGTALELALACDFRIAGENATFGLIDRSRRYRTASVLLPRSTSVGFALEVLLSGRIFDADAFFKAKIINRVASADHILDTAVSIADQLAERFEFTSSFRKQELLAMSGQPLSHVMARIRTPPVQT